MVAIFTGMGFGFERGSASVLGGSGLLGSAAQGRGGEGVYVNAATGNLVLQKQDEFLVGKGPDVGISRTYNSLTNTALLPDDNNDKWRQSTDRRVNGLSGTINTAGSTIKRISGDGTEITYSWDTAAAAYVTQDGGGAYDKIARADLGGGNYEWVWTDGDSQIVERYAYDATGKIKSQTDINGFSLSFAYKSDGTGRLETVTTSDGGWIRYDYVGATNNIEWVVTGNGATTILTRVKYEYDGSNRLSAVKVDLNLADGSFTDGGAYITTYGYDTYGRLATITQTDGSSLTIGYENNTSAARVSQLVQTATTGVTRTTRIEYGLIDSAGQTYNRIFDAANPSTSADENATRLYTDASGNLTKIMAPAAFVGGPRQLVEFTYNANGDVTGVKDALGNPTGYSIFTANGLAQTVTDRLNNPVTRTFDAKNHLLSETRLGVDSTGASVSLTTRFVYDTNGNLRFRIDPEGRVTEWEWGFGANTRTIEYTDDAYITAGTPSDANMLSWRSGLADSSKIAVVKYDYDGRNNLIASTRYGSTNTAGTFVTSEGVSKTNYVYDQAGQLLERWDEGKNHAVFAYDGMGRLKSEIDINGGQTTYVFNDTATTTTVTFTNTGYVVTKTYNKAGDLLNVTESGAPNTATGTTLYAYDSLGRVRMRTDAVNGTKTYNIYDNAGRLTGEVDHAGYLTEYRYDANNRLVGTIRYRIVSTANLANAAIPATWLGNPDNAVTIASIRPNTPTAQDISSWTVYDAEGRVRQTIAGDGSTVILTYDAAGRLQMSTAYFNKLSSTDMNAIYAAAQAVVITPTVDTAKDMVARNFYDKEGLLIGTLDALGYVVKNEYDKAGRLVATTAFANATTAPSPATAAFATLTSPANLVISANDRTTRLVYDARDLLRYKIVDVLVAGIVKGRVTAYYYQDNIDKVAREVVFDGYLAALGNYGLANVNTQTASLAASSGNRTSYYFYDAAERLSHSVLPTGTVSAFTYDIRGNVTKSVQFATAWSVGVPDATTIATFVTSNSANTANRVTRSWYTERGEAAYAVDAEGGLSRNLYNADGRQISQTVYDSPYAASDSTTLANLLAVPVVGGTRYWDYDSLGRLVCETDGTGAQTAYGYFGTTGLVTVKNEADTGSVTERAATVVAYDGAARAVQIVAATTTGTAGVDLVDATTTTAYDGRGMVQSITDPNSKTTSYAYYLDGRVKTVTDALGNVTTYEYNAFGEAWKVTDARGNVSYSWYDKLGRRTTSRDAGGYITRTAYTIFGEIDRVTRYGAIETGTPAMWTEPAGSGTAAITSFTYNKAGQVLTSTDAEGNAGNAAVVGETRIEAYGYNIFGDRTSVTNRLEGATSYTYDRLGRMTRQSTTGTYAATSNHNAAGTIVAGSQIVTTFAYDTRGNLTTKTEGFSTVLDGAVTALRTTIYKYDSANRVSEVWHDQVTVIADDMVTVSQVTPKEFYTYDQRGHIIKFVDAGGVQTFSYYDDLDRKTTEIRQLSATQWVYTKNTYDPSGNLTSTRVYEGNAGQPATTGGPPPTVPSGTYRQTDFAYDNLNRMTSSTVVSNAGNVITSGTKMTGRTLSAVDLIPTPVLAFVARYADVPAPQIATLRAIYRRPITLYAHQKAAASAVGLKPCSDQALRHVTGFLRRQCGSVISRDELIQDGRLWLYDHGYLLPGQRSLEKLAADAQTYALTQLKKAISKRVTPVQLANWPVELAAVGPNAGEALLDWLRGPPTGFGRSDIAEMQGRIDELKRLGAARIEVEELPVERMRMHARRIARRKASTLSRLKEPRRTVEIGCWLRLHLLELTDTVLEQTSRRIGQLWSQARRSVEANSLREIERYRLGINIIIKAIDDPGLAPEVFRAAVMSAILPLRDCPGSPSKLQAIRIELANAPSKMRALLKQARALDLSIAEGHPLDQALVTLKRIYAGGHTGMSRADGNPFAPAAARLIDAAPDPEARLAAYEVATSMLLKRCLRNGAASAVHSVRHRSVNDQLMPASVWAKVKSQTCRTQGWPNTLSAYLKRFEQPLTVRLEALREVIETGEIAVDGDRFKIPKLEALPKDPAEDTSRKLLFAEIGGVQLPDLIVAVDEQTRFSSVLLGRHATKTSELEVLYAGLLALGTEKTASEMARMIDGVSEDQIELAMRTIEESGHLRAASDAVASAMLAHPLASLWGQGIAASSDMMSLDATRHLWNARIEPRRGTKAIGTYTHVLDQWPIIYDQPVLLNHRQAGVALEGVLQQKVSELQHLAVDTHGFTHFAMATAKLLGFDLVPRLSHLSRRKLYLPSTVEAPAILEPMIVRVKPSRAMHEGWDPMLKLVASLKMGYGSVATIIERHGSAARGTPVFECGTLIGKVMRSIFLLDYLTKPNFRREIHRLLSQGESVHQLQRALMAGHIEAKHGRTRREISAVSGALTLLTNTVMAWNTDAMQSVINRMPPERLSKAHLTHIAPVAFRHINMHGKMRFALDDYAWLATIDGRKAG